ncbi:long-chain fatty acid--CoA ligase [Rhodococcus sp. D2-41]|uniref:long-chain-fatty-acid--CoA ligase n=1 Tax=Speluncibacter jeojiensis TaxID=2710754 RepID=UPI00240F257F|nr:long-chain fatty acid--CoA ligase [Rhodococcus sp. D2-41]MDG3009458.1 long-chain fatty acid--CoA ligase [Rhodococcus sp. D2-41]
MLNLAVILEDSAREAPDHIAIVAAGTRMTYRELDQAANRVAHLLRSLGLEPGDRVVMQCPNVPDFPVVYFGILKAGCVVVPVNVLLRSREIAYHLRDSNAKAFFAFEDPFGSDAWDAFAANESCERFFQLGTSTPGRGVSTALWSALDCHSPTFESASTAADDTAVILYTSGTTGQPKGAQLTHANMLQNAQVASRLFGSEDHDVYLAALPLFHVFGLTCQLNTALLGGASVVLQPRFEPGETLVLMLRERVTVFAGVPTMYLALLAHAARSDPSDLDQLARHLRMANSGGSALPLEVLRQFKDRFGVQILEGYGLSETSPIATFNRTDRPTKPGSVGLPIWGVQVKVVDQDGHEVRDGELGEIVIRGHNVMKGYHDRPDETAAAMRGGWFHTGDIGRRDDDGYFYVVDRAKDMIIRGGYNIYPRELEEVLMTHPAVSMVAVVGVPHPTHGEEVKAFIVPSAGADTTEDALVQWCRANMAAYKYPRLLEFRESLPLSGTGKVLKRELISAAAERN